MASDLMIRILREMREEIRATREEVRETRLELRETKLEVREMGERLEKVEAATARIPVIEAVVQETSQQQLFLSRWLKRQSRRQRHLETELAEVRGRVEVLEGGGDGKDA